MTLNSSHTLSIMGFGAALLLVATAHGQTWSSAQLLGPSCDAQNCSKTPILAAAAGGGFHAAWIQFTPSGCKLSYRRWNSGTLSPIKVVHTLGFMANCSITEAGNGDIHIVWENWIDTPDVGWVVSKDGGLSFSSAIELTNFNSDPDEGAKWPQVTPFGASNSGDVVLSVGRTVAKKLYCGRYNGSSWSGMVNTGIGFADEYRLESLTCRSLQDGTVYRTINNGNYAGYTRYDGYSWSSVIPVENTGFYARASVAANPAGQIMLAYEVDNALYAKLYAPGAGWSSPVALANPGGHGQVIAVSGGDNFYAVYCKGSSRNRVRGRRFAGGAWQAEEIVSVDQSECCQTLFARVAAGPDGSLYCVWEWWGNDNAEAWYSVKPGSPPGLSGTVAGVVRDQFGVVVPGACINSSSGWATVAGTDGHYILNSPAGTYNFQATKDYYTSQTVTDLIVQVGQTTTQDFVITGQPPPPVSNAAIRASISTQNTLHWTVPNGWNLSGTVLRCRTDHFPTGPTDGTLLMDDPSTAGSDRIFNHTNLANGVTYYYAWFTYMQDASRFYAAPATACATPAVKCDFDRDGDVDQSDFGHLQICLSGAGLPQLDSSCVDARIDDDLDVDGTDLDLLRNCLSGEGNYANPDCVVGG